MIELAVLSYNRPEQLNRILKNLGGFRRFDCRITVFDDASPMRSEILKLVSDFKSDIQNLELVQRPRNLGYDLNLITAVRSSTADYVILLSDDDFVTVQSLSYACDELNKVNIDYGVFPYIHNNKRHRDRRFGPISAHQVYDSILFSGLVFRPKFFEDIDLDFLHSSIYSQVYMAQLALTHGRFMKFETALVYLGSDGKNFFGKNPAGEDAELTERGSASADLKYQFRLLDVMRKVDSDVRAGAFSSFTREYRLRFVALLLRLRSETTRESFRAIAFDGATKQGLRSFEFLIILILLVPRVLALPVYKLFFFLRKSG